MKKSKVLLTQILILSLFLSGGCVLYESCGPGYYDTASSLAIANAEVTLITTMMSKTIMNDIENNSVATGLVSEGDGWYVYPLTSLIDIPPQVRISEGEGTYVNPTEAVWNNITKVEINNQDSEYDENTNLVWTNPTTTSKGNGSSVSGDGTADVELTYTNITYATDGDNAGFPNSGETVLGIDMKFPLSMFFGGMTTTLTFNTDLSVDAVADTKSTPGYATLYFEAVTPYQQSPGMIDTSSSYNYDLVYIKDKNGNEVEMYGPQQSMQSLPPFPLVRRIKK